MGTLVGHFQQRTDQRSGDAITHKKRAACIAWVWLALYGIAIAGSFLLGPEQQKPRGRLLPLCL